MTTSVQQGRYCCRAPPLTLLLAGRWAKSTLSTVENVDQPGPGTLRAYLATDVSQELWNSDMNPLRDGLGTFVKFCNPTVANGKVYAATSSGQVAVYGLFAADGAHEHACTDKTM